MKKIAIVTLLSAFAAAPALADNTGKFYVAGDLGSASYSNVDPNIPGVTNTAFPNPGMVRIAGGYQFSPTWAAEVGYSKFGDSVVDYGNLGLGAGKATLAMNSLQVAAVGAYPLNPQFDLIGKLGLASNKAELTGTGILAAAAASESKTDLLIGLGVQYHVSQQVTLRAQYDSFGKFTKDTNPIKASALSVGVAYSF